MTITALGLAALIALAPTGAGAAAFDAPAGQAETNLGTLRNRLATQFRAQDQAGTLVTAKQIEAHKDFAGLAEAYKDYVFTILAALYSDADAWALARPYLERLAAKPDFPDPLWSALLASQALTDDYDAAARSLTDMVTRRPALLADLRTPFIRALATRDQVDDDLAFALRLALFRANWNPDDQSDIWFKLVGELLARGRAAEAARVMPLVTHGGDRLSLYAMRRYDQARGLAGFAPLDVAAVLDADLEAARRRAEGGDPKAATAYGMKLIYRGRFEEVLALADAALAPPPPAPTDDETLKTGRWWLDIRSRALDGLGRRDEALAVAEAVAATAGDDTVSFAINLGWYFVRLDRPQEALDAVALVRDEDASGYGRMQAAVVRACAGQALGDADPALAEATRAVFDYMAEHWRDAPAAYAEALACRGDETGIADLYLRRLADPELDAAAVASMHDYLPAPHPTPVDQRMLAVWQAAVDRPEVVAARDAVGRRLDIPLQREGF